MDQLEKDLAFLGMPFYDAKPVIEKFISQVREDTINECILEKKIGWQSGWNAYREKNKNLTIK